MRIFTLIVVFLVAFSSFAQQKKVVLNWGDQNQKSLSEAATLSPLNFSENVSGKWRYLEQWEVNAPVGSSIRLKNVRYAPLNQSLAGKINTSVLEDEIQYSLHSRKGRDQHYAILELTPFVKKDGQVQRVISFDIEYAFAKANTAPARLPITNSVLSSGDFFKFYVEETGVYRITPAFLRSLGMSGSLDPNRIKIYGNGGAPLPLLNSENTEFDLRENPVRVVGGDDGSFSGSDYILFYGESTRSYHQDLDTHVNPYADRSYYYVTVNGGTSKKVTTMQQPTAPATTTFTTFQDYQFYEEDLESLVKVGRRWFGDRFGVENERSYVFNFPNVVNTVPARVLLKVAGISESSASLDSSIDGVAVGSLNIPALSGDQFVRGASDEYSASLGVGEFTYTLTYNNGGNPSGQAYLDYLAIEATRQLSGVETSMNFQNNAAATLTGVGEYVLSNAQDYTEVWDVTNPNTITSARNVDAQGEFRFKATLGSLRKYVAVHRNGFLSPFRESGSAHVQNQNLKGTIFNDENGNFQDIDYLMITGDLLRSEAERLAQHNRDFRGLNVKVVTLDKIYEEFGSGKQDIGAIRNFVRYVYENASSPNRRVKYLCMFGDASVDYKDRIEGNTNLVPAYHAYPSFGLQTSFFTDDYFGYMDPDEGYTESRNGAPHLPLDASGEDDKLDLAVGRIVADTPALARTVVDKIIDYDSVESRGRWRNNFVLVSDDADESGSAHFGLQVNLDALGDEIGNQKPFVNVIKIHSDAFQQESSAGGERYPAVNDAIANAIEVGSLVVTYLGHGGEDNLASEVILTQNNVKDLDNGNRLPVVVTVTCEFTKFDNPLRDSGGEQFIWNPEGGAVGMVTTTREISVSLGVTFNDVLAEELFSFGSTTIESVAEDLRVSKNRIGNSLRRVIFFLGDPAMKLAFPEQDIRLTTVNDQPVGASLPPLKALDRVTMSGVVTNQFGQPITNYNGTLAITLYDKEIDRQTLGNDDTRDSNGNLLLLNFKELGAILYRGQASVANGAFEFEFVMPRDTSIPEGQGRISFYAARQGSIENQTGVNTDIIIGGLNEDAPVDNTGPRIQLFMNDESFVDGGITNDSPFILAKLEDENGINTASGIGHDIIAIIDGDETNPIVMNDFYETEVDDFMRGTARRKIRDLEEGPHTLTFKAWDVYNNSATAQLNFVVAGDDELKLENVLNYPNPFVNYTEFWFNHNRPFEPLDVQVQVFTVSGKVVKTINQSITTEGFLSRDITWDGLDDFGQALGKGVYVYKITVRSTLTNKQVEKFEKLVIL